MWDEGFHNMIVMQWSPALSRDLLGHWLALVDDDGWLQRELIPGAEARRRVPREFQTQRPSVANPPTLLLAIKTLLTKEENQTVNRAFIKTIYPAVRRLSAWFFRTQSTPGKVSDPAQATQFRWAGRTKEHCLASGLDDYPRASWLPEGEDEGHVDLHSWMTLIASLMADLAEINGDVEEARMYRARTARLLEALDANHWNEERKMYCDFAVGPSGARQWVCHQGYVSLFPMLLQLLPMDSPKLPHLLSLLRDEDTMWSDYGVLSLAKTDPFFMTKENYWRGNIWLPMNFLIARSLHYYAGLRPSGASETGVPGAAEAYSQLKSNLVDNLYYNYEKKGYLYEQYSWKDGEGLRSHPFTGWTSTVLLIMGDNYE